MPRTAFRALARRTLPGVGPLLAAFAAQACGVDLAAIPKGRVTCTSRDECPSGTTCNLSSKLCVDANADDSVAPQALSALVDPQFAMENVPVDLDLIVNEALLTAPVVVFANNGRERRFVVRGDRPQGVDGRPAEPGQQPIYHLQYVQEGDEIDGAAALTATLTDSAGNTANVPLVASVTFDFTAPTLVADATRVALEPPPGALLSRVTALALDARLEVGLLADEILRLIEVEARPSAASSACGPLPLTCNGGGAAFFCTVTPIAAEPPCEEEYQLWAHLEDLAGNPADGELPLRLANGNLLAELLFDFTAPDPPAVDVENVITFHRMPWGSSQAPGADVTPALAAQPAFTVRGSAGAVEAEVVVVVLDDAEPADAVELGRTVSDENGAFGALGDPTEPLQLRTQDCRTVYVVAVDAAGNASDADSNLVNGAQASAVRDIWWTASLANKRAASEYENPHDLRLRLSFDPRTLSPPADGDGGGNGLDQVDGQPLSTQGAGTWIDVTLPSAPPVPAGTFAQAATDWNHGQAIIFGGATASNIACPHRCVGLCQGVKSLQRGRWHEVEVADPELDGEPLTRWHGSMAWSPSNGAIILFAGSREHTGANLLRDTWAWTGSSWKELCTDLACSDQAPTARAGHALATDFDRHRLVLFGGLSAAGLSDETWEWDGQSWSRACVDASCAASRPSARVGHAMAYDSNAGGVLLFGGSSGSDETWRFDGARWQRLCTGNECGASLPEGRWGHQLVTDPRREEVVLFGGCRGGQYPLCDTDDAGVALADTWRWQAGAWTRHTQASGAPSARAGATLIFDPQADGVVLVAGHTEAVQGICGFVSNVTLTDAFVWNGVAWQTLPETGPTARDGHAMAYDGIAATILMHGGLANTTRSSTIWRWDGLCWRPDTTMTLPAVDDHGLAERGDAQALLYYGGYDATAVRSYHRSYTSSGWTICAAGACAVPTIPARVDHQVVWGGSRFLLYGGVPTYGGTEPAAGFWEWTGSAWSELCTAPACQATGPGFERTRHAMVFDRVAGRAVLFGGLFWGGAWAIPTRESFRWTGTLWEEIGTSDPRPLNRSAHAMVFDDSRGRSVMFGGDVRTYGMFGRDDCGTGIPQCSDVWELDDAWAVPRVADPELDGAPAERQDHAMAYDRGHNQVVLFGGRNDSVGQLGDTWLWQSSGATRPAQVFHVLAVLTGDAATPVTLTGVAGRWYAGGTGMPAGVETHGVTLYVWDRTEYVEVATGSAAAATPGLIEWSMPAEATEAELRRLFLGPGRVLSVAAAPTAPGGWQDGRITTDYAEVTLRYRRP